MLEIKKESKIITINDIQKYVGISKDFNNFEFRKSIGSLNFKKAHLIAEELKIRWGWGHKTSHRATNN